MKRWFLLILALPPLMACPQTDPPAPTMPEANSYDTQDPVVMPPAALPPSRAYRSDWRGVAEGAAPDEFIDVRREGHQHPWLYDGGWRITHRDGRALLEVPFALTDPYEPLSFRRYVGTAFGPDGQLPRRYRIEAEARSLGGSKRFGGYGELAIQAFYVSPTTYVEVLQTDQHLLLWEAREAPPMQGKGWKRLARVENRVPVGEWLVFGAEVDLDSGDIVALLNGRRVARGQSRVLTAGAVPRFTLRATGNREEWRWVTVREMR